MKTIIKYQVESVQYETYDLPSKFSEGTIKWGFGDESPEFETYEEAKDQFELEKSNFSMYCSKENGYCLNKLAYEVDDDGDVIDCDVECIDEYNYHHYYHQWLKDEDLDDDYFDED